MLTELYIEALLINEELADQVWDLWDAGLIPDHMATVAWCVIVVNAMNDKKTKVVQAEGNTPSIPRITSAGSARLVLTGYPPKVVVSENSPIILHSSQLLILGESGEHGERVLGQTKIFWEILRYSHENGIEALYSLLPKDGRLFEELIAGAYKAMGAKIVELSPRSGDGGVDVWAIYELPAVGGVTLMDQVKLYKPGNDVDPGDIHRIFGADNRGSSFSKAVLSTTGRIPEVARREVEIYGERVILRDAENLTQIFDEIVNQDKQ